MNWQFALPVLFLLLPAVLFAAGGRKKDGGLFRQALPQQLLLFFLSIAISLFSSRWLRDLSLFPALFLLPQTVLLSNICRQIHQ